MQRGILLKTVRETWLMTLCFAAGMCAFHTLVAYAMASFFHELAGSLMDNRFFQMIMQSIMGEDFGEEITRQSAAAICWVHPLGLFILCGYLMAYCTRFPAGEIDRGTISTLLAQPIARRSVQIGEALVCLLSLIVLLAACVAGHVLGLFAYLAHPGPLLAHLPAILVNLLALLVAVSGIAALVSSVSRRRLAAIGGVFAIVEAWFLLNYLAPFWEFADSIAFLGALHYYRPLTIARTGDWPIGEILLLVGLGLALWSAAILLFARRDLSPN